MWPEHCELHLWSNDDTTLYFASLYPDQSGFIVKTHQPSMLSMYLHSLPEVLLLAEEGHELVDAGHALGAVPRVYQLDELQHHAELA